MEQSYLIKPKLDEEYSKVQYGKGIYLYDTDGKQYIDGSSGAVTASIGHGVEEVINAMDEQARNVSFVYRSQFTSDAAEKLATKLKELAPGDINYSFFVNSGSEATETALKVAIQHWQEKGYHKKTKIMSRWMSYHGITLGALAMSGHVNRRSRFVSILGESPTVSVPYFYREPYFDNEVDCNLYHAEQLQIEIHRVGKENIAAFIAEPIVGAAGAAITPTKEYYKRVKEICVENDILFISDEVMTGIGRTGEMFGIDHFDVVPDIITMGKGMSAGYTPMAATLISDKVMEPILNGSKSIMSGHTYSANPQSAATSVAVLDYVLKNNLVENSKKMGDYLKDRLTEIMKDSRIIGDVRGKGLMIGVEFVKNKETKQVFSTTLEVTDKIINECHKNGLLVYPSAAGVDGVKGAAIMISPPLTINKKEIDELVNRFTKSINAVESGLLGEIATKS